MANYSEKFNNLFAAGNAIPDAVQIKIDRKLYTGWESVSISRDLNQMTSSFTFSVSDKWRESKGDWPFSPGKAIIIGIGDSDPILSGYIDSVNASVTNESRSITVAGRDKTGDLVDSAAIDVKWAFTGASLFSMAKLYADKFSIPVTQDSADALKIFPKVRNVTPGETVFNLLSRLAKIRGVLLTSTKDGGLHITDRKGSATDRFADKVLGSAVGKAMGIDKAGLQQGQNVISASASFDDSNRFQAYLVKSQTKGNDNNKGKNTVTNFGQAIDSGVKRVRTKYFKPNQSMNSDECKDYAQWLANVYAVGSVQLNIVVQGWRNLDGDIWAINQVVDTNVTYVGISRQNMLITGVTFKQSLQGTFTDITLTRMDGFQAQPEIEDKKDPKKKMSYSTAHYGSYKDIADANGVRGVKIK